MDLVDTDEEMDNENVSPRPTQSRIPDSPYMSPIPFTSSNEHIWDTCHTANTGTGKPHYLI